MGLVKAEKILMGSDLVGGLGLMLGSDLAGSSGLWTNLVQMKMMATLKDE